MASLKHKTLIGIHGPLNSGKDTIAEYIKSLSTSSNIYKTYAFADPLREACTALFGFTNYQMQDRVLKDSIDPFWHFSPRKALQLLGTDYGRNMLDENVWLKRAEMVYNTNCKHDVKTIITDVRFENEAEWVRSQPNAQLIYIEVPNLVRDDRYSHESELGVKKHESDFVIVNDKSLGIEALYKTIKQGFE